MKDENIKNQEGVDNMKDIIFNCTLDSDIVLNCTLGNEEEQQEEQINEFIDKLILIFGGEKDG